MANYVLFGLGKTMFEAYGSIPTVQRPFSDTLLYVADTELGITNADGSTTFFEGTGFVWDGVNKQFTAGTVTRVVHFDTNGQYVDEVNGLTTAVGSLAFDFVFNRVQQDIFAGSDVLDARSRVGAAVVSVTLNGYTGNDTIYGGAGSDRLIGGFGDDTITGGGGNDKFDGGDGNDSMSGGNGNDIMWGSFGNDILSGGRNTDTAAYIGNFSSLQITQTATGFTVSSFHGGTDTLTSIERIAANDGTYAWNATSHVWSKISNKSGIALIATADETFNGAATDDNVTFSDFGTLPRVINGNDGNDTFTFQNSSPSEVLANGGNGDDRFLFTNAGTDLPANRYGSSAFYINGGAGNDVVQGGNGVDELRGGAGDDSITGNKGNDTLIGDAGADTFNFGTFAYRFRATVTYEDWGDDVITDFTLGTDHLHITGVSSTVVQDTAAGLLVTATYTSVTGNFPPNPTDTATILLKGVHGVVAIGDLLI
jgi:Ca2+-binding RTX toxin-like protein